MKTNEVLEISKHVWRHVLILHQQVAEEDLLTILECHICSSGMHLETWHLGQLYKIQRNSKN